MNIGRYKVIGYIGRGGMAEVFKCQLSGLGGFEKIVVIKRIVPERLHEPAFSKMFMDEARLVAHLSHQNVVQVFEIDAEDDVPYIVMEYIHGPTLRQALNRHVRMEPQNMAMPVRVAAQIACGLGYAHEVCDAKGKPLKLVHRDVNPSNILISTVGVSKLVDFGVAKASTNLSTTAAGTLKGKVAYMSPEQAQERPVDARSDIFSLGVVLYEATTGQMPFGKEKALAVLQAIVAGKLTPPSKLVDGYPKRLEELVMWALAKQPKQRCSTAGLLHDALEEYLKERQHDVGPRETAAWITRLFPEANLSSSEPFLNPVDSSVSSWHPDFDSSLSGSTPRPRSGLNSALASHDGYGRHANHSHGPPSRKGRWPFIAGAAMAVLAAAVFAANLPGESQGGVDVGEKPRVVDTQAAALVPAEIEVRADDVPIDSPVQPNPAPSLTEVDKAVVARGRARKKTSESVVEISSIPAAEITFQGKARGYTPLVVRGLPRGKYVLYAEAPGYQRKKREFEVLAKQTVLKLRLSLKRHIPSRHL